MKPLILPFAVFFVTQAVLSPAHTDEPPIDPRLGAILAEIAAHEAKVTAKKEERTQQYLADLKNLGAKIQATGDLDKVLQVSKEREAWGKGEPTPSIDPKDESFLLDLRKLRYYFEQDLVNIAAAATQNSEQARAAIELKFVELEKALTTEGKIPDALETRKLRERFVAGTLATLPNQKAEPAKPDTPKSSEKPVAAPVSFPLPDPDGYPSLPGEKGRMVLIPFPGAKVKFEQPLLEEIERKGYQDLVMLGDSMSQGEISAIRASGNPVMWKANGEIVELRNVSALKVWTSLGAGLIWIDEEGQPGAEGGGSDFEEAINGLLKVRYFSPTHNFAFAIDESGSRKLVGPAQSQPNPTRLMDYQDEVVSVMFGGTNYIIYLKRDGSVVELLTDKEPNTYAPPRSCQNLLDYGLARAADGSVVGFNFREPVASIIQNSGSKATKVRSYTGRLQVVRLENGQWLILEKNQGWQRMEQFEKALSGALDVYPTAAGIVAIVPAISLPRSGLWEVEELLTKRN